MVTAAVYLLVLFSPVSTAHDAAHRTGTLRLASAPNEARSAAGLKVLSWHRELNQAAQHYADELCATETLVHSTRLLAEMPSGFSRTGENIGRNTGTIGSLINAFEDSPSHYQAMVDPRYTHIGFGRCNAGDTRYVVYRFAG